MPELGDIIRSRRKSLGLTLDALALRAGCAKSYLSQIENGRRGNPPSPDLLRRVAGALLLPEERLRAAASWRAIPEPVKREVEAMRDENLAARRLATILKGNDLDALHRSGELHALVTRFAPPDHDGAPGSADRNGATPARRPRARELELVGLPARVPLINRVRAGYPTEFTDLDFPARIADEYVSVPDLSDPDAFGARVVGDSMAPRYEEGDVVVFSPERTPWQGSDCFVRFERDAETTFKRVYFERDDAGREVIRLEPLNPAYPSRTLPRDEVAGLYAAVWVMRPLRADVGGARPPI